ncbi:MAG: hypothetical protein ACJ764_06060 [Solirubrobacteraceae bacterium]
MPQSRHGDARIAELAGRQRGYVARRQLFALGENRDAIDYRVKAGRLIPQYAGVYAVGHLSKDPLDRAYGAVLACGDKAVLSHDSAAAVWGIYDRWRMPYHVTAPTGHRRKGIVVHRAKLHRRDRTRQLGLPVTSPARTVLDLAPGLAENALTRAVNNLRNAGYLTLGDLGELLERCRRHPGARYLRRFVDRPHNPTKSEFEDAFRAFCDRFDLPEPLTNTKVHGFEVDAFFPVEQVIAELDSWDFHSSRDSFRSDRDRDATMLADGIPTVRITWDRLEELSEREGARFKRILARRRAEAA